MSNSSLPEKIYELRGFQDKYMPLLYQSVADQFGMNLDFDTSDLEISYLLMCASILCESTESKHLDCAYRIAQYVIQSNYSTKNQVLSSTFILSKMTNQGALNLAIEREYIPADFNQKTPLQFQLQNMSNNIKYSIFDGDENIIPINKFQYEVMERLKTSDLLSISAPTSAGKSFILLQQVRKYIENTDKGIVVFVVPTRALIQQVEYDLKSMIAKHEIKGTFVSTIPTKDNMDTNNPKLIFVLTQERLQWLLNDYSTFVPDLLIVDEAQKIGDGSRGILLQQAIEEISKRSLQLKTKIIFSSPMTSNPEILLDQEASNKEKTTVEKDQITVNQNLIWVNQVPRKPREWILSLCVEDRTKKIGDVFLDKSPKPAERLPHLAHRLADTGGGNLIYVNLPSTAESVAYKLWVLQGETETVDDSEVYDLIELIKETVNPDYNLAEVLTRGVGYHYGNMPLIIKKEIERLFGKGSIKFLVCTSTLIEGINLPAKNIFLRGKEKGRGMPMTDMDFWNLAGRAGRQGKEFQGNVICVDTNNYDLWKGAPPRTKKKYKIEKSVDKLITKDVDDLLTYIENGTPRETSIKKPHLEYGFTYLTREIILNGELKNAHALKKFDRGAIEQLDQAINHTLSKIVIPQDILLKHSGISPIVQQELLNKFISNEDEIEQYLPLHPMNKNALDHYYKIITVIQEELSGEHPGKNYHYALLVIEWMKGYPLARIIDRNWDFWKDKNKKKQTVIRDTLKDIEEFARFKFIKYFACYKDILTYYLKTKNINPRDELLEVKVWLELGASENTTVSLIGLGFSRTTAIVLTNILYKQGIIQDNINEDLERKVMIQSLKDIRWEETLVSPIVLKEYEKILEIYI
jgi:superfamily II DNA/RNA helicase